jgi:hypothetical protein
VKGFVGVAVVVAVGTASFVLRGLLWRGVRWVDLRRREQLRAKGKVGLLATDRWRRN